MRQPGRAKPRRPRAPLPSLPPGDWPSQAEPALVQAPATRDAGQPPRVANGSANPCARYGSRDASSGSCGPTTCTRRTAPRPQAMISSLASSTSSGVGP